jgi:hypothetical protein
MSFSVWIIIPHTVDLFHKIFDLAIGLIIKIPVLFQVATNKKGNSLVKSCIYTTFILFNDLVAIITCLPVYKFHQDLALVYRQIRKRVTELFFQFFFPGF